MKFIGHEQEQFVIEMNDQEKSLFLAILSLFPQVPAAHHQLSWQPGLPDADTNQHLLEESLTTEKKESRQWITATFKNTKRFVPVKTSETEFHLHLSVSRADIEMLLQIFNDVRLGSWLALGSPDLGQKKKPAPSRETAPFIQRMELAGLFEMFFLKILHDPDAAR